MHHTAAGRTSALAAARSGRRASVPGTRALTYVELLLSMTVMALLFGGIISAMLIASQALPDAQGADAAIVAAQRVLDEICVDLTDAVDITEQGPLSVTFVVPDRDGDGQQETIHYAWSGVPGEPLVRSINKGTAENVLDAVGAFALEFETFTRNVPGPPMTQTSGETLLLAWESSSNIDMFSISDTRWPGEFFRPLLPPDAQSWSVTRVQFRAASRGPANGLTRVQLRLPDASNLPSATILEAHLMDEASLDTDYAWQEFLFSTVSGLAPDAGLCLVLEWVSSKHSAKIEYQTSGASLPNSMFVFTTDGGVSWSGTSSAAMLLRVYGTITTAGPPSVTTRTFLRTVHITLQPAQADAPALETRVRLLNEPEITP